MLSMQTLDKECALRTSQSELLQLDRDPAPSQIWWPVPAALLAFLVVEERSLVILAPSFHPHILQRLHAPRACCNMKAFMPYHGVDSYTLGMQSCAPAFSTSRGPAPR